MRNLTDSQLISSLDNVVRREREILADVLNHFKEFDRRKLFSKLGYSSLHEYAVKHLKYSDDQAYRRVQAMRLMREIPEIESKIEEGSLTLSSLSQAQNYFRKTDTSKEEKKAILEKLENATKSETKKVLNQNTNVRYSFEANEQLEQIVERLRGLNPHLNFDQLMEKICKFALEKTDPLNRAVMKPRATKTQPESNTENVRTSQGQSRYISASVKREVWDEAKGKCQNCGSTFALEFDHIMPFAKGGSNSKENIRLLCRSCNQRKAIEVYGPTKIERHSIRV